MQNQSINQLLWTENQKMMAQGFNISLESFSFIIFHEAAERRNLASRSKIITRVLTDRGIRRRSFHLTVRLVPVRWINLKRNCNKQNCNQRSELSTAPAYLILSIDSTIHHIQQHARNCSREKKIYVEYGAIHLVSSSCCLILEAALLSPVRSLVPLAPDHSM